MARKMYFSVDDIARKILKSYIGVECQKTIDENITFLLRGNALENLGYNEVSLMNVGVTLGNKKSKFGNGSMYFDGSSSIQFPCNPFDFKGGDFTIDWWEYAETDAKTRFCTQFGVAQTGMSIGNNGTAVNINSDYENIGWDIVGTWNIMDVTVGNWVHWALVRNGSTLTVYKNGVALGTKAISKTLTINLSKNAAIGVNPAYNNNFIGYIEEFRISNVARWISNFSVPNAPCETKEKSVGKRIDKGYIEIGGVARPFWGFADKLAYYGTITGLSAARGYLSAATVGGKAIFAGGALANSSAGYKEVDVYDESLTHSMAESLKTIKGKMSSTTVGENALFMGGMWINDLIYKDVEVYNKSLTHSLAEDLSESKILGAATTVGNYAIVAGDSPTNYHTASLSVEVYDESLTHSRLDDWTWNRFDVAVTTVDGKALFAGGDNYDLAYTGVDVYDESLTHSLAEDLSIGAIASGATTVGQFAIFAGGDHYHKAIVDVYDESLTHSLAEDLSIGRMCMAAVTLGKYAIIAGGSGNTYGSSGYATVDIYDESLTHSVGRDLSIGRGRLAATVVGNYAIVAGGQISSGGTDVVEAYMLY